MRKVINKLKVVIIKDIYFEFDINSLRLASGYIYDLEICESGTYTFLISDPKILPVNATNTCYFYKAECESIEISKYFCTLADWREIQINKILDEELSED